MLIRRQPDSAWRMYLKPALTLLAQLPPTDSAHRMIGAQLGLYHFQRREFAKAIREWIKVVRLSETARDTNRLVQNHYNLSAAYADIGLYEQTIDHALQSLRVQPRLTDPYKLSGAYAILATNYRRVGNLAQVERYDKLALDYAGLARAEDPGWEVLLRAEKYSTQKKYRLALEQFRLFIAIQTRRHSVDNVAHTQLYVAQTLNELARFDEARQAAEAAIGFCRRDGDPVDEAKAYDLLAHIWLQQGQPVPAIQAARRSVALARQSNDAVVRSEALKTLADAQESGGQYRNSLQTTHQLQSLTDSVTTANKIEVIAAIQARFDLEQKDNHIDVLNKNLAINELKANQQRLLGWLIIGSLAMGVSITVFFLRRSNRQKREIETQAAQLTEINGVKDRLFSIVSHDLRGPVMSLQQSLDRLETASPATQSDALPRFRQSVNAVAALTDNVLCWALSQMGGLRTRPQSFAVQEVMSDVLALCQETVRQKNIEIIINDEHAGEAAPLVLADENQTEIAIRNIVQNALKFSPVGGRLTVSVEPQNNQVSVLIADEGPGFDWQSGYTGTTRASSNSTGLGLMVVEDLMRRNGGTLQISRRINGTTGTVARLSWPTPEIQRTALSTTGSTGYSPR